MARDFLDIEDIPKNLESKVKQDLKFKTGNFIWQVKFNTPLDPKSVNNETMYVLNTANEKLKSDIRYDVAKQLIEISPQQAYAIDEYYLLNITQKVKSKGGQTLKEPVQIKFKL